jgi:hypothetical protein
MNKTTYKEKMLRISKGNRISVSTEETSNSNIQFNNETGFYTLRQSWNTQEKGEEVAREEMLRLVRERQEAEDRETNRIKEETSWLKGYYEGLPD